jgi:hypothetical protein
VPPTHTPDTSVDITRWRGEYFNSPDLSGTPALVRDDSAIAFDWGNGSPGSGVPIDNFSARWTRTLYFTGGRYRFQTSVDDGVRLWVDDQLLIDEWNDGPERDFTADYTLDSGDHDVAVEYYDNVGDACMHLTWERSAPETFTHWMGQYWANAKLKGTPELERDDVDINFNWGTGAVVSWMPVDRFSARWSRTIRFNAGTYRFNARVDDGVRMWVDDDLILDSWQNGSVRLISVDYSLAAGNHDITVEYFENVSRAQIRVWWARIGTPTPTDTATPTDTPTSTDTATPTDTPTSTPETPTSTGP